MPGRYIAFDVETPNHYNNRMSSIGVAVVEGGKIVQTFSSLINPECPFDYYNIHLTGITPSMVQTAPTFPELWSSTLEPLFDSGMLVAHNAGFDMRVLAHCLIHYGISWKGTADYCCTVALGRKTYPSMPNHKLDTLCYYLNIDLHHHQADSDAIACAKLLINYMEQGTVPEKYKRCRSMISV